MCADACNQAERSALGTVQYTFRRESVNPYPMEGGGGRATGQYIFGKQMGQILL